MDGADAIELEHQRRHRVGGAAVGGRPCGAQWGELSLSCGDRTVHARRGS
jgi:hypothetical protein